MKTSNLVNKTRRVKVFSIYYFLSEKDPKSFYNKFFHLYAINILGYSNDFCIDQIPIKRNYREINLEVLNQCMEAISNAFSYILENDVQVRIGIFLFYILKNLKCHRFNISTLVDISRYLPKTWEFLYDTMNYFLGDDIDYNEICQKYEKFNVEFYSLEDGFNEFLECLRKDGTSSYSIYCLLDIKEPNYQIIEFIVEMDIRSQYHYGEKCHDLITEVLNSIILTEKDIESILTIVVPRFHKYSAKKCENILSRLISGSRYGPAGMQRNVDIAKTLLDREFPYIDYRDYSYN